MRDFTAIIDDLLRDVTGKLLGLRCKVKIIGWDIYNLIGLIKLNILKYI